MSGFVDFAALKDRAPIEQVCAQQLEELASLLDSKHCDLVHLY